MISLEQRDLITIADAKWSLPAHIHPRRQEVFMLYLTTSTFQDNGDGREAGLLLEWTL
jgi:hypothetical protein